MRVFYPPWKLRTRVLFCLALSWHVPRRARRKGDDDALTTVWFGGFSRHAHKCTKCLLVRSFLSFSLHVRSRSFVMEPSSKRFCFSSPEERQRLVDDAIPKRTADSNSFWKSVFLTNCQSIGKTIDFSTVTAADLAPILESFFVDVRGKNGEPYKGNSLKAAKGAIQRLLSAKDRRINIFQDAEFDKMRKVFAGLLKDRRRSGEEASVLHKEPLTDADWKLLHAYFADAETTLDAIKLCRYVWFYVTLHFCFRGTEIQVALKKDALQFVSVENVSGPGSRSGACTPEAYSASSRKSRKLYCVVSSSSRASCRGCSQCSWSTLSQRYFNTFVKKRRLSLKLKRKRKDWCFLSLVHLSASEVFFASKKKDDFIQNVLFLLSAGFL